LPALGLVTTFAHAALPPDALTAMSNLVAWRVGGALRPVKAMEATTFAVLENPDARREWAAALAGTLARPDLSPDAVGWICRELGRPGEPVAAPALVRRLVEPDHAEAARIALEAIPGAEASDALRHALEAATGGLQIGCFAPSGGGETRPTWSGSPAVLAARRRRPPRPR